MLLFCNVKLRTELNIHGHVFVVIIVIMFCEANLEVCVLGREGDILRVKDIWSGGANIIGGEKYPRIF